MKTKAEELAEKHWMAGLESNTGCKQCVKQAFLAGWRARGSADIEALDEIKNSCRDCYGDIKKLDRKNGDQQ